MLLTKETSKSISCSKFANKNLEYYISDKLKIQQTEKAIMAELLFYVLVS